MLIGGISLIDRKKVSQKYERGGNMEGYTDIGVSFSGLWVYSVIKLKSGGSDTGKKSLLR